MQVDLCKLVDTKFKVGQTVFANPSDSENSAVYKRVVQAWQVTIRSEGKVSVEYLMTNGQWHPEHVVFATANEAHGVKNETGL